MYRLHWKKRKTWAISKSTNHSREFENDTLTFSTILDCEAICLSLTFLSAYHWLQRSCLALLSRRCDNIDYILGAWENYMSRCLRIIYPRYVAVCAEGKWYRDDIALNRINKNDGTYSFFSFAFPCAHFLFFSPHNKWLYEFASR